MKKILLNLSGVLLLFMIMPFTALSQTPLTSGVPVNDSVSQGQWKYYSITSSATDTQIEVKIEGLTDDVDLYVKAGSQPTASVYDCRPYSGGTTTETCTLPNTGATTWYIGVNGYEAGSYTVTAVLNSENEVDTITSGVPVNDSVSQGQWKYYSITSSATDTQIEVKIEGLTDDVDLYVKAGSQPTASVYDCRPYGGGTTTETCTLPNTGATTWYIGVNGYEAGSYIVTAVLNSENEVETICDDSLDNDEDGLVDCEDPDCDALTTYFDTGADGFVYADDIFYSTGYPEYASGNYASGDGYSGGGLHVALGGVDGNAITNGMSGGWSKDFTLIVDSIVNITFRYRLVMTWYEPDECSRVLVAIDGTPVPGPDSYLEEVCDGPGDSGWKEVTIDLNLSAGPHTITVGGWNNKKDQYFEITDIYFDDIAILNMCTQSILCGNGNLDNGEECDNGPDNGATVCGCQSDCTYTPVSTSCADGAFCNGDETCDGAGICQPGTPQVIDDGVGCTDDSCDEANDVVVNVVNDANCDNGQFCDGSETCDAINDCQTGTPPLIDDGVGCTDDSCDEANDVVVNAANDANCDNGQFCDGSETCDAINDCLAGTPPCNPANESCNEVGDTCVPLVCLSDGDCDNGQFCDGAETCNLTTKECQPGTPPVIDDGVGCTYDSCDEANDVVVNDPCLPGEICDETQDICIPLVQCPCFDAGQIVGVFENSCADGSGGPDGGICNVSMRERLFAAGSEKESESYLVLNVMSGPQTGYQYVAGVERNAVQGCYIRINGEYVLPQTSTDISDSEYELCHRILKEIQIFPTCE